VGLVDGKVVLVTGGGSGIGRAGALSFGAEGAAAVAVVDVNEQGAAAVADELRAQGVEARPFVTDVTDEQQVAEMVAGVVGAFGRLDCAFNNAGISGPAARFVDIELADWQRVLAVDLTAVFLCMKHELRVMLEQRSGAIVNTSSGAGVIGFPSLPHYVAAKHGVLGLTKTAALEHATKGIRVNAICPGVTDTPMVRASIGNNPEVEARQRATVPTGEFGRPEQVAAAAVWLCSDQASWVTGESMLVDGGSVCR
jgi:NAD(P)-dependent dehydrogenase (short-subunit alcohol dehydrogenase family)